MLHGRQKSGGQGRSFRRVPGTYSPTETNSDGDAKLQCVDCTSEAKHSQKAGPKNVHTLNEPGSNNYIISVTSGAFQANHFFENKTSCIFIMRVIIIQRISVF